ncbi:MAG: acetyl-coenzyme A synthetase N-terminal domain-containing protein [Desulfosalsimonas sp.]|uniref:acetyl-coenzyme A synthetase N-terminal domain-containing protein n=1 Tax=Desulfosalsimonas sp. TaxID=3073848 RepID=UPI003970FBA0
MTESAEIYGQHLAEFQKTAYVKGMDEYQKLHRQSIEDPEGFWAQQAEKYLSWEKKWDQVLDYDFTEARISWFSGGVLNASYNCLDRHMDTIADKIAYYWEGDNPEDTKAVT